MKYLSLILVFYTYLTHAKPQTHELPVEGDSIVFYTDLPLSQKKYPLLLGIDGSYVHEAGPLSVFGLLKEDQIFASISSFGIGLVLMERRGISQDRIDKDKYHSFNTPSQRLADHLSLVKYLREKPPENWNGQLFILGGSEGGPIAVKLSDKLSPDACITLVGCGDQTFKEFIWHCIDITNSYDNRAPWLKWIYIKLYKLYHRIPSTRQEYEKICEQMKLDPDPKKFWYGQTYLYWSDALQQSEREEFLRLKCPLMVVAGSRDFEYPSTDRLIKEAKDKKKNVLYLRVEGMAHNVSDPKFKVIKQVIDFILKESKKKT